MIRNTATTVLLTATITAAALTQATYVRAASRYDGNWSVVVYTRSGPCDPAYRFSGQIINGAIAYGGGSGSISPDGSIRTARPICGFPAGELTQWRPDN